MIQLRKILIGLISVAAVVIVFVIYTNISETVEIEQSQNKTAEVLERPDFTGSPEIDGSGVGEVDNAEFITRDEITKKISRIFGFEKLLNPEKNTGKWRLQKPYMQFFGDDFKCRITSDEGNFQIEKVMGKITPQNARLYGNVRLEITFENEGVPTDGVIYLEDLDYDSERSELATDKFVRAVFDDAVMEGTGMILIYNSARSRIEYFEMKDLDFIRIKNLAMMSKDRQGGASDNAEPVADVESAKSVEVAEVAKGVEDAKSVESAKSVEVVKVARGVEDVKSAGDVGGTSEAEVEQVLEDGDYYHCRFLKDVTIEYGDELVVKGHEELNIKNLLFSQASSQEQSPKQSSPKEQSPRQTTSAELPLPVDSEVTASKEVAVVASDNSPPAIATQHSTSAPAPAPADVSKEPTEVVLTCKQGFVVQLMSNVDSDIHRGGPVAASLGDMLKTFPDKAENIKSENSTDDKGLTFADAAVETPALPLDIEYANFISDAGAAETGAVIHTKPTRFHARKIDFDMTTKYAYAAGPINLLIYGKPDPNAGPDQEQVPVNITATDNCQYFGAKDQIVFNGEVEGLCKITDEQFITENSVHGDQLVVDLDSGMGENSISHISVLGENVMLFSTRKAGEDILSLVRLKCLRIDYDATDEFVLATGPGVIEIDNSNISVPESSDGDTNSEVTLKEPCYAMIEDFDLLKWYTVINKIVVDGSSDSVRIQHIPIVEGELGREYGKVTYVAARNIEANFETTPQGRTELAALTASDTVSFMEKDEDDVVNSFIGDKLFYNVAQSQMLITGTEGNPCMANGFITDKISYNLATGEVVAPISGTATIDLPVKPKYKRRR